MAKKVMILGDHPIADDLVKQYESKGYEVARHTLLATKDVSIVDCDELCLLTSMTSDINTETDDKAVAMLGQLVTDYDMEARGGQRLTCHLLVQSQSTLQMLQTTDFCEAVRKKADIYPFTMDEVWSRSIVPDYEPITVQSERHVHLVVFGMGEMAEMVAIHVAHIAHYPNYVRNHSLRTRITMIDERAEKKSESLISNYRHLFDNSYYRVVKPSEEKAVMTFHKPIYEGRREDFVDVEWEFVEAASWNADLREKLQLWSKDNKQLLTVVMADRNGDKNVSDALHLPQELFNQQIPVYVYCRQEVALPHCSNIHCFGMTDRGYDVSLPLIRMAKNVNHIYDRCYDDNYGQQAVDNSSSDEEAGKGNQLGMCYAVEIDPEKRELSWARLSNVKRMSCIYNALTIETKMRSIGLETNEWDKFYDIPQKDIELLAQVEHNRWSVEELILGFRPCTDDEQKKVEEDISQKKELKKRKVHYDLRAFSDLRPDETGKPVTIYDLCLCSCLPMITKAFVDEEGGKA